MERPFLVTYKLLATVPLGYLSQAHYQPIHAGREANLAAEAAGFVQHGQRVEHGPFVVAGLGQGGASQYLHVAGGA